MSTFNASIKTIDPIIWCSLDHGQTETILITIKQSLAAPLFRFFSVEFKNFKAAIRSHEQNTLPVAHLLIGSFRLKSSIFLTKRLQ